METLRQRHLENMSWADYADALDRESLERVIAADSMQRPRDKKAVPELRREAQSRSRWRRPVGVYDDDL